MGTHPIFESDFDCLTDRIDWLMSERKRSWDGLDDELLEPKKGKIETEEEHDDDALLLNEDLDDDLLKDSDEEQELENELNGDLADELDLGDKEESKTDNGETAEFQEVQKEVPASKETPIANKADELALDLEEEELDYDDELSDDGSGKRESKFKSERKVENDEPIRTKSPKDIPDSLEVSKEVQ